MRIKRLIIGVLAVPALAFMLVPSSSSAAGAAPADAASTYKAKCAGCHGAKAERAFNRAKSDAQLLSAALKGVKPKMPAYESSLGADTCKGLIAYMKSLK
jgi:mono/diheme cytochrome c family protein